MSNNNNQLTSNRRISHQLSSLPPGGSFHSKAKPSSNCSLFSLDFLGSAFKLTFKDSDTYKTGVGGFLSLLLLLLLAGSLAIIVRNYIDTTNPEVSISMKSEVKPPKIDLLKEQFFMAFFLIKDRTLIVSSEIESYVTIIGRVEQTSQPDSTHTMQLTTLETIRYRPCSTLRNKTLLTRYNSDTTTISMIETYGFCPEITGRTQNFFIESRFQDPPFVTYNVYVYPCTLRDSDNCKPVDDLDKITVKHNIPEVAVDVSNMNNPITQIFNLKGTFSIDTFLRSQKFFSIKQNSIEDDRYDFVASSVKFQFFDMEDERIDKKYLNGGSLSCTRQTLFTETVEGTTCFYLLLFTFESSPKTLTYIRKYPKLMKASGEFGGIAEIMMLLFVLGYSFYNQSKLDNHMKKYLFGSVISKKNRDLIISKEKLEEENANLVSSIIYEGEDGEKEAAAGGQDRHPVSGTNLVVGGGPRRKRTEATEKEKSEEEKARKQREKELRNRKKKLDALNRERERKQMSLINRLVEQNIKINQDGMMLFKSLNKLRVLEDIIFESHDKVLLPLVILSNMKEVLRKQKEEEDREKLKTKLQSRRSANNSAVDYGQSGGSPQPPVNPRGAGNNLLGIPNREQENTLRKGMTFNSMNIEEALQNQREMSVTEAYERLLGFEPENELKRCVKQYILERLPPNFAQQLKRNDENNLKLEVQEGGLDVPGRENRVSRGPVNTEGAVGQTWRETERRTLKPSLGSSTGSLSKNKSQRLTKDKSQATRSILNRQEKK